MDTKNLIRTIDRLLYQNSFEENSEYMTGSGRTLNESCLNIANIICEALDKECSAGPAESTKIVANHCSLPDCPAILAEKLRKADGIGNVRMQLNRDGSSFCELFDRSGKLICMYNSWKSLTDAIERCAADWKGREKARAIANIDRAIANIDIMETAKRAAAKQEHGIFSDKHFSDVVHEDRKIYLAQSEIVALLKDTPEIVRLGQGQFWMLLPDGCKRFVSDPTAEAVV